MAEGGNFGGGGRWMPYIAMIAIRVCLCSCQRHAQESRGRGHEPFGPYRVPPGGLDRLLGSDRLLLGKVL